MEKLNHELKSAYEWKILIKTRKILRIIGGFVKTAQQFHSEIINQRELRKQGKSSSAGKKYLPTQSV